MTNYVLCKQQMTYPCSNNSVLKHVERPFSKLRVILYCEKIKLPFFDKFTGNCRGSQHVILYVLEAVPLGSAKKKLLTI